MEDVVRRLTGARLRSYSPVISTWQGQGDIHDRLECEMRELLGRTTDEEFGRHLMSHFPTEGVTDPSAYMDSLLQLEDESLALTGIRYRGGDPHKPFIDIVALEGGIAESTLRAVEARWAGFAPLCVRLAVPSVDAVEFGDFGPRSRVDCRFIAGRITDIRSNPCRVVSRLSVQRATDMSWYERYEREYDKFRAQDARRKEWTHEETHDSPARTLQESGIFLVTMNDDLAGVYSMPRGCAHGLRGFRVQEKFLFESARGRGFGAGAEQMVIGQLPAKPEDVVFGSVEGGNTPSRRSAYRTARVDIGVRLWLTPLGRPGMPT